MKFKDNYDDHKIIEFIDFLEKVSYLYVQIETASSYNDDLERCLQNLKYHSSRMSIMPLIISVCCNDDVDKDDKARLLN